MKPIATRPPLLILPIAIRRRVMESALPSSLSVAPPSALLSALPSALISPLVSTLLSPLLSPLLFPLLSPLLSICADGDSVKSEEEGSEEGSDDNEDNGDDERLEHGDKVWVVETIKDMCGR